jgi:hypothetical protein
MQEEEKGVQRQVTDSRARRFADRIDPNGS